MLASPAGPHGRTGTVLALVISVVTLIQAGMGCARPMALKQRSLFCVTTSAICIAVSCLIQSLPVAGLLGCTAFAALAIYIAFFHSARFLTLNAILACAITITLAVRVANAATPVLAVCAACPCGWPTSWSRSPGHADAPVDVDRQQRHRP